ncbi:hypothetical protein ACSBR1_007551 [Camellia fascicularis]
MSRNDETIQYRSNLSSIVSFFETLKFNSNHLEELQKTPFWYLIQALTTGMMDPRKSRKSDDNVVAIIQRYNEKTKAFTVGKKSLTFTTNDMTLIFGLQGGKGAVLLKYSKKPNTAFLRRRFPKDTRLIGPVLKNALVKAMKGKQSTDFKDVAIIVTLYLCLTLFFATSGNSIRRVFIKYVEPLESMKPYDWPEAITATLIDSITALHKTSKKAIGFETKHGLADRRELTQRIRNPRYEIRIYTFSAKAMLSITRIANHYWLHCPLLTLSNRPSITKLKLSTFSSVEVSCSSDEECDNFLPWLERKAGMEISSVLSIGKSAYGRSLLASKSIEPGDCMLKVPFNMQIAPDNLLPEINSLLPDEVSNVAKLAIVIIVEQKMGQHSEWAPFMSRLPQLGEMHNTIFWSDRELDMIRQSSVYQETIKKNVQIEKNFLAVKPAFDHFPEFFDGVTFDDFRHAYALVESRAWRSTRGVSLIPFADFLNHDDAAEEVVLSDEDKKLSEVIADCNYSPGDQVLIRYGKFSNATLLLDFGFTLSYNIYDEVRIQVNIPRHDPLCAKKLELLHVHCTPAIEDVNGFSSSQESFTIKGVRSAKGKGRGIPQSLRAFARVLCSTSSQELSDLVMEAAQNDGRLARYPLKNKTREMEAHWFLLSKITRLAEEHSVSIKSLEPLSSPFMFQELAPRKQMARDLLAGELRVLNSASEWLKNYCTTLSKS